MNDFDFDIEYICNILIKCNKNNIILEYIDEYLQYSVSTYKIIRETLNKNGCNHINLYISADSTFGSSVDDVSALHVNGDIIVHFGNDLSGSGTIPVMIVPKQKTIDMDNCYNSIGNNLIKTFIIHLILITLFI